MKPADLIQRLGYLALGTRLKRIGEALQAGVNEAFAARGIPVQPGQVAILVALSNAELTVGELVAQLGLSQPGVSRSLGELTRQGLVVLASCGNDRRVRLARLTDEGRDLMVRIDASLFRLVEAAAARLCDGLDGPLLEQLTAIDRRLAHTPFAQRVEEVGQ
jgi:DNA-binding MarR family transcriptional regulator